MELNDEVLIEAARERVWAALNDAGVLQACIPGCEQVVDESPTVRSVRLMIKLGPVRARFNGRITLSEVEQPVRCVMAFEGSGGAAGMASGRSQVELTELGNSTRLAYSVKASVGGKLGQIGGRMIDASAKQLADQFFAALQAHLVPVIPALPALPVLAAADSAQNKVGTSMGVAGVQTLAPAAPPPASVSIVAGEFSRVLWFALGVASTGFGVWLGAKLF